MSSKPSHSEDPKKGKKISANENTNEGSIAKLKAKKGRLPTANQLAEAIINGDTVALSRAITLTESTKPEHIEKANKILELCLPHANNSIRIGITGVPGVGKSTFIESLGSYIANKKNKLAVLAIDPSSSVSKGSILGDKTRMESLVNNPNVYIRPSAAGTSLGGVARKTRESIILCEACGFNTIFIETVGVGQSETAVHSMADFFLLLKLAGAGDELQGIKRGIIELADAIVINKADGHNIKNAEKAKTEFNNALHLYQPKSNGWTPEVLLASAIENKGIQEIWELIENYIEKSKTDRSFHQKRAEQNKFWLYQTIDEHLKSNFYQNERIKSALGQQLKAIENNETTPFAAAQYLLSIL
ncbi:methylmalonyl Co-A mutase-associated GTPase MeaB [Galbibacter sp. EGI 63066]|uniref:methylmalonyl Co-A mutase-associated GTPase MeaB n=1 Tax=Galbibacter sp. EGI 63066 TaxID=2993559 RepID=UPI002248BD9F|nr:methylmalonyl Co-A mutase-associated GTPase MeaB [Galbibacter sp. EGI 63066]MCX2680282.1 methylmalonyl Co-A mutase-associated GTPase MeaB [Galbibacter sp. EGI 63066]